jgi:hypothetical protein
MNKLLVSAAALGAAAILSSAIPGVASTGAQAAHARATRSEHSRPLYVTKDCTDYQGLADQSCTIKTSNVPAIKPESRVVYLQAAVGPSLDSDIILVVGPGSYALGHVNVDLSTGLGTVRLNGGAGPFRSFHARAAVSPLGGPLFAWEGRYRFEDD